MMYKLMQFLIILSLVLGQNVLFAKDEVPFETDKHFIMAGYSLWFLEADSSKFESIEEFISNSREILKRYKDGKTPFDGFEHSEKAMGGLWFLIEETFKVYEVAKDNSKKYLDFEELMNRQFITIRTAILKSNSHEDLKTDISNAVKVSIDDILKKGNSNATGSELQFVYAFFYGWFETFDKFENQKSAKSGTEVVKYAKAALDHVKNQLPAPSDRSMYTADFCINKIIEVLESANLSTVSLQDFWNKVREPLDLIYKAIEQGLTKDKSLKQTEKKVKLVAQRFINNTGGGLLSLNKILQFFSKKPLAINRCETIFY